MTSFVSYISLTSPESFYGIPYSKQPHPKFIYMCWFTSPKITKKCIPPPFPWIFSFDYTNIHGQFSFFIYLFIVTSGLSEFTTWNRCLLIFFAVHGTQRITCNIWSYSYLDGQNSDFFRPSNLCCRKLLLNLPPLQLAVMFCFIILCFCFIIYRRLFWNFPIVYLE